MTSRAREDATYRFPGELHRFLWALLFLMFACFVANLFSRKILHLYFEPFATPFFSDYFPDFIYFIPRFQHFHAMAFF